MDDVPSKEGDRVGVAEKNLLLAICMGVLLLYTHQKIHCGKSGYCYGMLC